MVLVLGCLASLALSNHIGLQQEKSLNQKLTANINQARSQLQFALQIRISALQRMAKRWTMIGGIDEANWDAEAALFVQDVKDVDSMLRVDAQGIITREQSKNRDRIHLNQNLLASAHNEDELRQAFQSQTAYISPAFILGGKANIFIWEPIFTQSSFDGFLAVNFHPNILFQQFLAPMTQSGYAIRVYGDDGDLLSDGPPAATLKPNWSKRVPLTFGPNAWQLEVTPSQAVIARDLGPLPLFLLLGGFLLSLLATFGINMALHNYRTGQHLAQANQKLEVALQNQKDLTVDLQYARDRADQANRLKSEFLANMSHEIRTPMNAVIGFTQLLEKSDLNAQQLDWAQVIRTSGEDLLSLLNNLLDLSKIEAGHMDRQDVDFNISDLVGRIENLWEAEIARKGITFNVHIDDALPNHLHTDQMMLRQVLHNLISNAIKFTEEGSVRVTVQRNPGPRPDQIHLHCSVTDTGPGIAEEHRSLLFEKFTQVDGSLARKHGGTGLGLSLCQEFVEILGGALDFTSEVGVGSTFFFEIPCTITESEAAQDHSSSPQTRSA